MHTKQYTIPNLLSECRSKSGKKPAIVLPNGNKISYGDMMWDISRTAGLLREQGIAKGKKVALFMENGPQTVETFLAITIIGAVAVPIRYDFSTTQIASILETEKPDAVFIRDSELSLLQTSHPIPIVIRMADNMIISSTPFSPVSFFGEPLANDTAAVVYLPSKDGALKRRFFSHKAISNGALVLKMQKRVPVKWDTIVDYAQMFIMPVLNGIGTYCRDVFTNFSVLHSQVCR